MCFVRDQAEDGNPDLTIAGGGGAAGGGGNAETLPLQGGGGGPLAVAVMQTLPLQGGGGPLATGRASYIYIYMRESCKQGLYDHLF